MEYRTKFSSKFPLVFHNSLIGETCSICLPLLTKFHTILRALAKTPLGRLSIAKYSFGHGETRKRINYKKLFLQLHRSKHFIVAVISYRSLLCKVTYGRSGYIRVQKYICMYTVVFITNTAIANSRLWRCHSQEWIVSPWF